MTLCSRLAWDQFRFERKLFWRNPSAAFFNFVLPLICSCCSWRRCSRSDADELDIAHPRHRRA